MGQHFMKSNGKTIMVPKARVTGVDSNVLKKMLQITTTHTPIRTHPHLPCLKWTLSVIGQIASLKTDEKQMRIKSQ